MTPGIERPELQELADAIAGQLGQVADRWDWPDYSRAAVPAALAVASRPDVLSDDASPGDYVAGVVRELAGVTPDDGGPPGWGEGLTYLSDAARDLARAETAEARGLLEDAWAAVAPSLLGAVETVAEVAETAGQAAAGAATAGLGALAIPGLIAAVAPLLPSPIGLVVGLGALAYGALTWSRLSSSSPRSSR